MITRKFWFDGRARWFLICVDGAPVAFTSERM
jgi:hypothetical protein